MVMWKQGKVMLVMMVGLFLVGLACNVGGEGFTPPAVTIPAGAVETAQAAAGTAAVMAATGAAQGGAAVETAVAAGAVETAQAAAATGVVMAATGAAQGGAAVATVAAAGTPDLSALREKLEALRPDENGNVSVTITDDEVNQAIQANEGQGSLENPLVTFTGGTIVLAGDVTQPVAARLTVVFVPYVEDGVVWFDITQATLGSVNVPASLLQSAESTLNSTLGDALNNMPGGVQVTAITMGEGTMVVMGRREA